MWSTTSVAKTKILIFKHAACHLTLEPYNFSMHKTVLKVHLTHSVAKSLSLLGPMIK